MTVNRSLYVSMVLSAALCVASPAAGLAQGTGRKDTGTIGEATASIVLTKDMRVEIRSWYDQHPSGNAEALPPGIRKRLTRGKPLPPGIAKKVAPSGLRSRIRLPDGYQLLEVGLDMILVDAATSIVHDILEDVVH